MRLVDKFAKKNTKTSVIAKWLDLAAISEYVNLKIGFLEPKKIIDFEKYPPEVRVEHKTCSTICGNCTSHFGAENRF